MATVYEKFDYQANAIKAIESNLKTIRNLLGVVDLTGALSGKFPIGPTGTFDAFNVRDDAFKNDVWKFGSLEYYINPDTDESEHKVVQDGSMCKLLGEMQAAIALPDIGASLKDDLEVIVDAFQRIGFRSVPKS